jgi:CMP-N-acetylneuraminic acid synthetase
MQHAVEWLRDRERYRPDWVMILMPTSPLRQPEHITDAVALALASGADSVVSVDQIPAHFNPMRALAIDEDGWARLFVGNRPVKDRPVRRQDLPPAWVFNGAIYLFRAGLLLDSADPSLYGERVAAYAMPHPYGTNIDGPDDWAAAERYLAELS